MSGLKPSQVKVHIREVTNRKGDVIEKRQNITGQCSLFIPAVDISPGQLTLCLFIPECLLLSSRDSNFERFVLLNCIY